MSDDEDPQPLLDPRLFAPGELLGDDMEHSIDVTGETTIEVAHDLDVDLPVRRLELGALAFALLVVALGLLTPVGVTVQLAAALAVVLVGDLLL